MLRIITIAAIVVVVSSSCSKSEPQSHVTKEDGDSIVKKLSDINTNVIAVVNKVNNHEARITNLETRSGGAQAGGGVTYALNPNAPLPPLTFTDSRPPAGANLASPVLLTSPASPIGYIQLPPCDLAIKFGEFKKGTELHLATLDDSRKKQDEKLVSHDTAIGELTKSLGKLTEKVDGFTQGLDQIKQEVQSLKPTPPPPAEAPSPTPPAEASPPSST